MPKAPASFSRPRRAVAKPPRHLEAHEREMWNQLHTVYDFSDPASVAILTTTLEAHQRARRCREVVDRDGEAVLDRFKQTKMHPLLTAERDARASFLAGMRVLDLDLGAGS